MAGKAFVSAALADILAPVVRSVSVDADNDYSLLGVRWYGNGCHTHSRIHGSELKTPTLYRVKEGDIVYNKMWTKKGAFAVVDEEHDGLFATAEYPTFEVRPGSAAPEFLRFALTTTSFVAQASAVCRGTTSRARLNPRDFMSLQIVLPPLGEQRKIAAILASVDETIEKTAAVIAQLQVVKKAMMQELLTRGLPGRHTRFEATELGEIPDDWRICRLHDLVSCCDYGLSTSLSQDASLTPVLRMGNLSDGEVILDDLKYVDDELPLAKGLHLDAGDILFNRTNSAALVGKVAIFRGAGFPVTFASYLLRMKPRADHADSEWLNYVLNASRNQERLRALATPGVSQANINRGKLLALALAVPGIEEQRVIAQQLAAIDRRIQAERRTMSSLVDLKQALMSVLLTGEVRVTPDEDTP